MNFDDNEKDLSTPSTQYLNYRDNLSKLKRLALKAGMSTVSPSSSWALASALFTNSESIDGLKDVFQSISETTKYYSKQTMLLKSKKQEKEITENIFNKILLVSSKLKEIYKILIECEKLNIKVDLVI